MPKTRPGGFFHALRKRDVMVNDNDWDGADGFLKSYGVKCFKLEKQELLKLKVTLKNGIIA